MDQASFEAILSNIKLEEDFNDRSKLNTIPCKLCSRTFTALSGLSSHYKAHARKGVEVPRVHKCQICDQVLSTKQSLERHIRSHQGSRKQRKTGRKTKKASRRQPYPCHQCGKICWKRDRLASHIRTKHPAYQKFIPKNYEYQCLKCGKICWNKKRLAKHLKIEHRLLPAPAAIEVKIPHQQVAQTGAGKTPVQNDHSKRHNGNRKKLNICLFCGKKFASESHLRDHIVVHTKEKPFQCQICKVEFSWKNNLDKHSQNHSEKDVKCERCDLRFVTKKSLEAHAKTEHGEVVQEVLTTKQVLGVIPITKNSKPPVNAKNSRDVRLVRCMCCDKQCDSESHLVAHMLCHTNGKRFQCLKCTASYAHERSLLKHYRVHHPQNNITQCSKCEVRFPDEEELESHLKSHEIQHPLNTHSCTVCENVFPTSARLDQHTKTHEATICSQCNKQCLSKAKLMSHMASHVEENMFQCPTCKIFVESKESLTRHMKFHTSIGSFKCQECQLSFLFGMQLKRHRDKNHPSPRKPESESDTTSDHNEIMSSSQRQMSMKPIESNSTTFPSWSKYKLKLKEVKSENLNKNVCKYCGKVFRSSYDVNRHQLVHTRDKSFIGKCPLCDKSIRSRGGLERHLKIHGPSKLKMLKCKYCDKQFNHSSRLKLHLLTHEEEKKFQCTKCDERVTFSQIDSHMKTHSANNKIPLQLAKDTNPCVCKFCGKRICSAKSLKIHYMLHNGDTPYNCDHAGCSKSYVQPYLLKRHVARCHVAPVTSRSDEEQQIHKKNIHLPIRTRRRGRNVKQLKCEQCDKFFSNKSQLSNHQLLYHADNRVDEMDPNNFLEPAVVIKYACEICNNLFSSTDKLRNHKKTHVTELGLEYQCRVCLMQFRSHEDLITHQLTHIQRHPEVPAAKPFICPICKKVYANSNRLRSHKSQVHSAIKKPPKSQVHLTIKEPHHKCETCGQIFKTKDILSRHKLLHGPKQFECDICAQKFPRLDYLRDHNRNHHSTSKDFECLLCEEKFLSPSQRSEHRRKVHMNRKRHGK